MSTIATCRRSFFSYMSFPNSPVFLLDKSSPILIGEIGLAIFSFDNEIESKFGLASVLFILFPNFNLPNLN